MAVNCYTGTPGSGKSTHLARDCFDYLKFGKTVISNTPLKIDMLKNMRVGLLRRKLNIGKYIYKDNEELDVSFLVNFAIDNMKINKDERVNENQFLLVIDECHVFFNCREFTKEDRNDWIDFFKQHRKIGYTIILVTQDMRAIDKQIRAVIEDNITHRDVTKFGGLGNFLPKKVFVAITRNVGMRTKIATEFFIGSKFLFKFFNSYSLLGSLNRFIKKKEILPGN